MPKINIFSHYAIYFEFIYLQINDNKILDNRISKKVFDIFTRFHYFASNIILYNFSKCFFHRRTFLYIDYMDFFIHDYIDFMNI